MGLKHAIRSGFQKLDFEFSQVVQLLLANCLFFHKLVDISKIMKRSLVNKEKVQVLICIFLFASFAFSAQTITANQVLPVPGDSLSYQNTLFFDAGPNVAGQLWDFSQIVPNGIPITKKYKVFNTPLYDSVDIRKEANLQYEYYGKTYAFKADSTAFYDFGTGVISYNFSHKQAGILLLKLPLQINNFSSLISYQLAGTLNQYGSSIIYATTIKVDGSGTLVTPCGTYTNVLRIFRSQTSTQAALQYSPSHDIHTTTNTYEWYCPAVHGPILSVSTYSSNSFWTGSNYLEWGTVYNDISKTPLGLEVLSNSENTGFSFQNPVHGLLQLKIDNLQFLEGQVQILNQSGQIIWQEDLTSSAASFDLTTIAVGLYYVQVKKNQSILGPKKLLIQR